MKDKYTQNFKFRKEGSETVENITIEFSSKFILCPNCDGKGLFHEFVPCSLCNGRGTVQEETFKILQPKSPRIIVK